MTEQEYLDSRVLDQIKWYSIKSSWNQKWYKRIRIIEFILAVLIPFLASYIDSFWIGLMGVVIAICAGVLTIYKFHENWIKYRTTSETLKHHLNLFQTKVEPYHDEQAFSSFVHIVEGLISKENSEWQSYIVKDKT